MIGSADMVFNYSDSKASINLGPHLLWLADKFSRPEWAFFEFKYTKKPSVYHLIYGLKWFLSLPKPKYPALDAYFKGDQVDVMALRTSWTDPNAVYLGIKVGQNNAPHGNLDAGTFVLDALGERWAFDMGLDYYGLPGYFNFGPEGKRWEYYVNRAEGHNIFVFSTDHGSDQNPLAKTNITMFKKNKKMARVVINLTQVYAPKATDASRGIVLYRNKINQILIQDEINPSIETNLYWFMHISANTKIENNGKSVILKSGNVYMTALLLSPTNTNFSIMEATPLPTSPNNPKQKIQDEFKKLTIKLITTPNIPVRIAVLLIPSVEKISFDKIVAPPIIPIRDW